MSLTREALKAMDIDADKIDQIIRMHTETFEGLKNKNSELEAEAAKVPELEKKVEELSTASNDEGEWQTKYEAEHESFEKYKAEVEKERETAVKTDLFKALLRESGVDEKRIESIVKVTDLASIEVKDGAIKDRDSQAEKVRTEWADFIVKKDVKGAEVDNPPATDKDDFGAMSLAEKMDYANSHPGDPSVREWLAN